MSVANFHDAVLYYGTRVYPVPRNEITPFPESYHRDQSWQDFGRTVCAMLSNASGGHTLRDCKLRIYRDGSVTVSCSGGRASYYSPNKPRNMSAEQAIEYMESSVVFHLGNVRTDQYGEGWQRAVWF